MESTMSRNTRSKTALQEQKGKHPNIGIFIDTSGHVSETLHLDWSRIYSIFDNDNFSTIPHDHPAYAKIRSSQLHCIVAWAPFMPYTDPVKWELDNVNPNEFSFEDHVHTPVASFHLDIFSKAYELGPPRQLLSSKFLDEAISRFNNEKVVKSWMENPTEYVPKPTNS